MSRTLLFILLGLLTACAPLGDEFNTNELGEDWALDDLHAAELPFAPPLSELPNLPSPALVIEDGDGVVIPEPPDRGEVIVECVDLTLDFDTCADGTVILPGDDLEGVFADYGVIITAFDYDGSTTGTAIAFNSAVSISSGASVRRPRSRP